MSAILQDQARSSFNRLQYADSMRLLLGLESAEPQGGGTAVTHHAVISRSRVIQMLSELESRRTDGLLWPAAIMSSSDALLLDARSLLG